MKTRQWLAIVAVVLCGAPVWAQAVNRAPRIGYLYPAGGQAGKTFQIAAGGQYLQNAKTVYVSGSGVTARVVEHVKPLIGLDKEQRQEIQRRLKERRDELLGGGSMAASFSQPLVRKGPSSPAGEQADEPMLLEEESMRPMVQLPDHPLLRNIDHLSLRELQGVTVELFGDRNKKQQNRQLAETVEIEVTIAPGAAPGDRELRLQSPQGLTNPLCFQVGSLPEALEMEPNDPGGPGAKLSKLLKQGGGAPPGPLGKMMQPKDPPLELPVVINGQIKPGDIDRIPFKARKGQQIVIQAQARQLIPYLADAVPGWFQATLALFDEKGEELAYDDDFRFSPDPVLFYKIPADGVYEMEIHDSLYRGREDFVYRVSIGELPFITGVYPLGAKAGEPLSAWITGWNLSADELALSTSAGSRNIRQAALRQGAFSSNPVSYAVDTLPECYEKEPNDSEQTAQAVEAPVIVNGFIGKSGDTDVFRVSGRAGETLVAEVVARRLNSPLDSLIRITDSTGRVLGWNDDYEIKEGQVRMDGGLMTHYADSYLSVTLPKDGPYFIRLTDAQNHGDAFHGYRLRIAPARPDFALRVTPSSLAVRGGGAAEVCAYVLRKDGFDGPIDVALTNPPNGYVLQGGRIPTGCDRVFMTLAAPRKAAAQPVALEFEGRAAVGGQTVRHPAIPCEDMMQAFLYRHLLPAQQLLAAATGKGFGPSFELVDSRPIRIPPQGVVSVGVKTQGYLQPRKIDLELKKPSEGVALEETVNTPYGLALRLKAKPAEKDKDKAVKTELAGNLIVEAFTDMPAKGPNGKAFGKAAGKAFGKAAGKAAGKGPGKAAGKAAGNAAGKNFRVSLGMLPAIPYEVVQ